MLAGVGLWDLSAFLSAFDIGSHLSFVSHIKRLRHDLIIQLFLHPPHLVGRFTAVHATGDTQVIDTTQKTNNSQPAHRKIHFTGLL
jgi:hypothetical protein